MLAAYYSFVSNGLFDLLVGAVASAGVITLYYLIGFFWKDRKSPRAGAGTIRDRVNVVFILIALPVGVGASMAITVPVLLYGLPFFAMAAFAVWLSLRLDEWDTRRGQFVPRY